MLHNEQYKRFVCCQTLILAVLYLAGCASTGIIPVGKDTYTVSKQSATGYESAVGVKGDVLREANDFCAKRASSW